MRKEFFAGLLFLLMFWVGTDALDEDRIDRVLQRMESKFNTTEALSYSFNQRKSINQLEGIFEFSGKVIFRKPHFMKLELRGEENLDIYMNGENIWLVDVEFGDVEIFPFEELGSNKRLDRLLPLLMLEDIPSLKQRFSIEYLKREKGKDFLRMIPKNGKEGSLSLIEFSVDRLTRIRHLRIEYSNGDWTETQFKKWEKLPKISKYFFQYRK